MWTAILFLISNAYAFEGKDSITTLQDRKYIVVDLRGSFYVNKGTFGNHLVVLGCLAGIQRILWKIPNYFTAIIQMIAPTIFRWGLVFALGYVLKTRNSLS
ncbi:MAG: hypothetical protein IPK11_15785 [Ignavibacteria bacterium]|nr:hypothetical protein [Ignavibacteria bacterium]